MYGCALEKHQARASECRDARLRSIRPGPQNVGMRVCVQPPAAWPAEYSTRAALQVRVWRASRLRWSMNTATRQSLTVWTSSMRLPTASRRPTRYERRGGLRGLKREDALGFWTGGEGCAESSCGLIT
eukprot:364613-Chlamydomonas_euryale.AAC.2